MFSWFILISLCLFLSHNQLAPHLTILILQLSYVCSHNLSAHYLAFPIPMTPYITSQNPLVHCLALLIPTICSIPSHKHIPTLLTFHLPNYNQSLACYSHRLASYPFWTHWHLYPIMLTNHPLFWYSTIWATPPRKSSKLRFTVTGVKSKLQWCQCIVVRALTQVHSI